MSHTARKIRPRSRSAWDAAAGGGAQVKVTCGLQCERGAGTSLPEHPRGAEGLWGICREFGCSVQCQQQFCAS